MLLKKYFFLFLACFAVTVHSEDVSTDVAKLNAVQFENWLEEKCKILYKAKKRPIEAKESLLARIKADRHVTDKTFHLCVSAWVGADSNAWDEANHKETDGKRFNFMAYKETFLLIDELILLIPDRASLVAALLYRKVALSELTQLDDADACSLAGDVAQASMKASYRTHLEADQQWVCSMLLLAKVRLGQNKIKEAEDYFREVRVYPWYNITDARDISHKMAMVSREASKGLIDCCAGDLKKLETFIIASESCGESTLYYLAGKILSAGGDPDKSKNMIEMRWKEHKEYIEKYGSEEGRHLKE